MSKSFINVSGKKNDKGERTDISFKDIYDKVPKKFYDVAGFVIVVMMIGLLSFEEIYRMISLIRKYNFYTMFYYLVGAFAEIFSVFYIGSLFYREEKFSIKKVLKNNIWDLALLAMLIWSVISTFLADDLDIAMHGTWYRRDGLYTYLVYAGMYVSAKAISSDTLKMWVYRIISIVATGLSFMTLFQCSDKLMKLLGAHAEALDIYTLYAATYYNTNHYAYFLTLAILAMAGLVIVEKKLINKIIFACMYVFNIWALIINDTFGSYLGVMIGIIFLGILFIIKSKKNIYSVLVVIILFAGMSLCMNIHSNSLQSNLNEAYENNSNGLLDDSNGNGRIGLWKQAVKFIKEKPVFGYGPDGLWEAYFEAGFLNDRPHNEYLQHMVFLGIPGGSFYLIALVSIFVYCIRRIKKLDKCILVSGGIVCAYCISAFFGNTMYYTTPYFFIFLGMLSTCHSVKLET
jgi:O-antigen ligase